MPVSILRSNAYNGDGGDTTTFDVTNPGDSYFFLVAQIDVAQTGGSIQSAVTVGGQLMTLLGTSPDTSGSHDSHMEFWGIGTDNASFDALTGVQDVVLSGGNSNRKYTLALVTGCDPTNISSVAWDDTPGNRSSGSTNLTTNVDDGDMVLAFLFSNTSTSITSSTPSLTGQVNTNLGSPAAQQRLDTHAVTAPATTPLYSFTLNGSEPDVTWGLVVAPEAPSAPVGLTLDSVNSGSPVTIGQTGVVVQASGAGFTATSGNTITLTGPFGSSVVSLTSVDTGANTGEFDVPADFLSTVGFPGHHTFTASITNSAAQVSATIAVTFSPESAAQPNAAPGAITVASVAADTLWDELGYTVGDKLYVTRVFGGVYEPTLSNWPDGNPIYMNPSELPVQMTVYRATSADSYVGSDTADFQIQVAAIAAGASNGVRTSRSRFIRLRF